MQNIFLVETARPHYLVVCKASHITDVEGRLLQVCLGPMEEIAHKRRFSRDILTRLGLPQSPVNFTVVPADWLKFDFHDSRTITALKKQQSLDLRQPRVSPTELPNQAAHRPCCRFLVPELSPACPSRGNLGIARTITRGGSSISSSPE